ncbi:murein biosynthesis integral membrane protein MurJ [Clostridium algidicarnis]|uniref:murein biosynthesis integral membrane protein MurJ n=1 Tax=Clostridium algidicarnis TaxID=37659 RepID=UPI0016245241|nr:murein biosynthesis integral membrane protein MurJ [Clostridium algidicarnis]MBB6698253.1 murein biosynthesis integral membrane protein MurJ [Clostridium algidicarnis]
MRDRKNNNIVKSVGILTVLMIASKVISLVREMAIAVFFGVTSGTDAYFVAGGFITNIFFGITAALAATFVPFYIETKVIKGEKETYRICSSLFTALSVFAVIIIIVLYIGAPFISKFIAPSYTGEALYEVVLYMRIYSLTILFSLLTSMLTSILNAESVYGYGALASLIYSITSIVCMVLLKKYIGVTALAISVPLSFFFQLTILLIKTRKFIHYRPTIHIFTPELKSLLLLMLPVLLGNATIELNQLITRTITSGTGTGAVSVLSYSNTLFNFVSTLISTTIITVYYTEFSSAAAEDEKKYNSLVSYALRIIIVVLLPISVISSIFSKDIVTIAFGRGQFDQDAIRATATCLSVYSIAFVFDSIRNLLIRAYYAKKQTKIPMINSCISLVITASTANVLSKRLGVTGVVISIVISIIIASIILLIIARKRLCVISLREMMPTFIKAVLSATIMAIGLWTMNIAMTGMLSYLRITLATIAGLAVYIILLLLMRCSEVLDILSLLKKEIKSQN